MRLGHIPSDLVNKIKEGQCIPFIGAGFSKAAGLPLWGELIESMKHELLKRARETGQEADESTYLQQADPLQIADRFKNKLGKADYYRFLRSRYGQDNIGPAKIHKLLACIEWPFIITTNYDKLLEQVLGTQVPARVVVQQTELDQALQDKGFFVLKLHGDIDRLDSIVLGRQEYDEFVNSERGEGLLAEIRRLLIRSTVLFLGFGLRDPNFLRVFGEAGWLAQGYQQMAYAVVADATEAEQEEWKRKRLCIIPIAEHDGLLTWLEKLCLSLDEVPPESRPGLSPQRVPFTNQEDLIERILSTQAESCYLLTAPAGYGKTELLRELERRFKGRGWTCAYSSAEEHSSLSLLASDLAQKLGVSLEISSDNRRLGANLAGALTRQKADSITQKGLVLLIDLGKKPSLRIKDLLEEFIPGVQKSLHRMAFFALNPKKFRVVIAGRFLAGKCLKLAPFDYEVVRDTAMSYLVDHSDSSITQISAHVMHLTGGHPGCMAHVLEMYKEMGYSPDDFLTFCAEDIQEIVWREIDNIRNSVCEKLRTTLDNLSILRYFDYGVLYQLINGGNPIITGYNNEDDLAKELTYNYLFDWKGPLLRDDITRRLLAIRLRKELGPDAFYDSCKQAREICKRRLQDRSARTPEMWTIEYLFQYLQGIKNIPILKKQRNIFFDKEVPQALQLLVYGQGSEAIDNQEPLRKAHEEYNILRQALETDNEFRFTVNYFLREGQYDNEGPYNELLQKAEDFFRSIFKVQVTVCPVSPNVTTT